MVYYFLEGGAFMWPILLTLIFGLGFVLERAYSLMMSGVNSDTFFKAVTTSINEDGAEAAKEKFRLVDRMHLQRTLRDTRATQRI